jgi:DNA-binding NtrC family response regulator
VHATDTVIDAMRQGAFDYIVKPYDTMDLAARIHRAMRMSEILSEASPNDTAEPRIPFKNLVGVSSPIRNVMAMIEAIARVPSTTLIIGETGTDPFKSWTARPFRKAPWKASYLDMSAARSPALSPTEPA